MTRPGAALLLGAGALLLAAWAGGLLAVCLGRRGPAPREVLAATGLSWFQLLGGAGCAVVFAVLWAGELRAFAAGETPGVDRAVLCWSTGLALLGLAMVWMALTRRVWCTASALVQRTWRGELRTAPYGELRGVKAAFSFDDVVIGPLTLDGSLPGFGEVAELLRKQGVDMSAMPPRRGSFFRREEDRRK